MRISLIVMIAFLSACSGYTKGPDKQFAGSFRGAALGAGAGAVTGFHVTAATGPGAAIGAGLGAVYGGLHGIMHDSLEDQQIRMNRSTQYQRERVLAQEILFDQYQRRLELHPAREIYPADLFFAGDSNEPTSMAYPIVRELAAINKNRFAWSRLGLILYVQNKDAENNEYSKLLAQDRSAALGDMFVAAGINPRRIETRAMLVPAPVLMDPNDHPFRYSHAIELVPLDR